MKTNWMNALLLGVMACVLSGCLIMSGSRVEESGVRVSPSTLNQVQPGETSEAWLLATLGEPTSRSRVDDTTEILRYSYRRATRSGGTVFLIFAGSSHSEETSTVYFEVEDGVVVRHWTEQ